VPGFSWSALVITMSVALSSGSIFPPPTGPTPPIAGQTASAIVPTMVPASVVPSGALHAALESSSQSLGVERVDMRTEDSRTFERPDGSFVSEIFAEPIFYREEAGGALLPIVAEFAELTGSGATHRSSRAPAVVSLSAADGGAEFLTLQGGGRSIGFGVPTAVLAGRTALTPETRDGGRFAEFVDLLPGGVDLRIFPSADGAKSFLVLEHAPVTPVFTFTVRSPGLTPTAQADGSVAFVDAAGVVTGRMPRPFMVDSSDIEGLGSGTYSEAVTLSVAILAAARTVTIAIDPAFLATATYPVYVDPTVTVFPTDTGSASDTFVSEANPTTNYNTASRPDSPYYHEHWLGEKPGTPDKENQVYVKFTGLSPVIGEAHIDRAELRVFPYHQYADAPDAKKTWIKWVTATWTASTMTWNTKAPTIAITNGDPTYATTVEGETAKFVVTKTVQDWMDGALTNNGFMLHQNGNDQTYWKRLIAREDGGANAPRLRVAWHRPTASLVSPVGGANIGSDRRVSWTYADNDDDTTTSIAQSHFRVQVATTSAFTTILTNGDSGEVAGTATSWSIPSSVSLTAGTTYHWRVKAKDGTGWSSWASSSFTAVAAGTATAVITAPASGEHRRSSIAIAGTAAGSTFASYSVDRWAGCTFPPPSGVTPSVIAGSEPITTPVTDGTLATWNTGTLNGLYTIRLLVNKTTGGLPAADFACITVDNTSPTATLTSPPLFGTSPVVGTAADNLGFKDYVIEWAAGANATTGWTLVDAAHPTYTTAVPTALVPSTGEGAALATWDTSARQGAQTLRVTVRDLAGNAAAVATQNVWIENGLPGEDGFTFVPFDMGGGWTASVGVHDGALVLDRELFTVPSYGPPQALRIHYNSRNTSSAARFGAGWSSNLTQYLEFSGGFVLWHTEEGTVVPFQLAGTAWKPLLGRYETMAYDAVAATYTITAPDQSRLVFAATAPGRLKRVEDRHGKALTLTWNTTTATATDASSRSTTMTIDGSSRITNATDSAGRSWGFGYTSGELTTVTDPAGNVTSLSYTSGDVTSVVRARTLSGNAQTITWSFGYADGRVASVTDPEGGAISPVRRSTVSYGDGQATVALLRDLATGATAATTYSFDERGLVVSQADPLGFASVWIRTSAGDLASQTDEVVVGGASVARSFTYDANGNLVTEVAPAGGGVAVRTTYSVDASNDLTDIRRYSVLPGGGNGTELPGRISLTYAAGRLQDVTLNPDSQAPELAETEFTYASNNLIETETAADGVVTKYEYDIDGNRTAMVQNYVGGQSPTSDRNVRVEYAYDHSTAAGKAGLVTSETDALGRLTKYEYDTLGRLTKTIRNYVIGSSATDANVEARTSYDELGWEAATIDARGTVTRTVTDRLGRVTKRLANCTDSGSTPSTTPSACIGEGPHDTSTNVVTDNAYDAHGNLVRETVRNPDGVNGDVATVHEYDGAGRLVKTIVDHGTGKLNLVTESAFDGLSRETARRDSRGTVTASLYDDASNLVKTIVNCTEAGTTPPGDPAWKTCDGDGTVDASTNVSTAYTYDERGNTLTERAPNGSVTTFTHDAADRIASRTDNDVDGTPSGNEDLTTTFAYDSAGREVGVRAPTASRTEFGVTKTTYDALGRRTSRITSCTSSGTAVPSGPGDCTGAGTRDSATNLVTSWTYDASGDKVSEVTASPAETTGTSTATVTTRYAYDGLARLCRVLENASVALQTLNDPCGSAVNGTTSSDVSTQYGYDPNGNLTSMTDGRGNTSAYSFDRLGRMAQRTDAAAQSLGWLYDERGNRTGQVNRVGSPAVAISWAFDAADRMVSRAADGSAVSYGYDAAGNRVTAQGPPGTITSTWDRLGRELTVDGDDGADTTFGYSHSAPTRTDPSGSYSFTLDKFGRETSATTPVSGVAFSFTYRADGQRASKDDPNGNGTDLTYDAAGRFLTSSTTSTGGSPTRASYAYTYNRAGLRLSETSAVSGDPANGTGTYGYDELGRLATFGSPLGSVSNQAYGWQAVSNRSSVTASGTTVTTSYSASNRPTSDTAGATYSHDLDGRLTARPGQTLEWDSLGRLIKVSDSVTSNAISQYTYDALDRLRTVDRSGSVIRFRYVGSSSQAAQVVNHGTGASIRRLATTWHGDTVVDWSTTGTRYVGRNGHFDTTWTAGSDGAVDSTLRYDPWGNVLASSGVVPDWRFQGTWTDAAAGLSWVLARWYSPALGRFVSEDELLGAPELPKQRHLYSYSFGDPINYVDSDGRLAFLAILFIAARVAAAIAPVVGAAAHRAAPVVHSAFKSGWAHRIFNQFGWRATTMDWTRLVPHLRAQWIQTARQARHIIPVVNRVWGNPRAHAFTRPEHWVQWGISSAQGRVIVIDTLQRTAWMVAQRANPQGVFRITRPIWTPNAGWRTLCVRAFFQFGRLWDVPTAFVMRDGARC
jgi:RHS repeat-associated protein